MEKVYYIVKRRNGKNQKQRFTNKMKAKKLRDRLNKKFYGDNEIPKYNREYYISKFYLLY